MMVDGGNMIGRLFGPVEGPRIWFGRGFSSVQTPTHWVPLPAAPQASEGGSREIVGRYEVSGRPVYADDNNVVDADDHYLTPEEAAVCQEEDANRSQDDE